MSDRQIQYAPTEHANNSQTWKVFIDEELYFAINTKNICILKFAQIYMRKKIRQFDFEKQVWVPPSKASKTNNHDFNNINTKRF